MLLVLFFLCILKSHRVKHQVQQIVAVLKQRGERGMKWDAGSRVGEGIKLKNLVFLQVILH